jgi:excisionase family DNA binding protein
MLPKLYTYKEVQEYLGIKCRKTLLAMIERGELQATKNKRIPETSILKYVNGEV